MIPIVAGIVSSLLSNNLPKIAQAVVDKGLDYVQEKTGIELKPDMTPEEINALREQANKHEEFKIEQANKNSDSARFMQSVALAQEDVFSKRFVMYFAIGWSVVAATYIALITFANIPQANIRFADTILGFVLGTLVSTIINFFYGSAHGSSDKQETIKEVLHNQMEHK